MRQTCIPLYKDQDIARASVPTRLRASLRAPPSPGVTPPALPIVIHLMMMKVTWRELLSRLNGLGFGPISVSWTPPVLDRNVAASVLAFLDDREVLYASTDDEVILYSMKSVESARRMLTEKLMTGGIDDDLSDHLRAMRAACRHFVRATPEWSGRNDLGSN